MNLLVVNGDFKYFNFNFNKIDIILNILNAN